MEQHCCYCFDCLQLRINSDFSDQLLFNYGISSSPFPFGSSAVVQISGTAGSEASSGQFILQYTRSHHSNCFSNYVNEYILDSNEGTRSSDPDTGTSQCGPNVQNGGISSSSDAETKRASSMSTSCSHSGKFSCFRIITSLAPGARVEVSSFSTIQEVATDFLSGLMEDHVLDSLDIWIEGKASGRDSTNFLSLIGLPFFQEDTFPGSLRHPNIAPVLAFFKSSDHVNMVLPKTPYNLENILHFNPSAFKSDWHRGFLIYQLLSALVYLHGLGVSHGNLCPSNIMLTDSLWSWLRLWNEPTLEFNSTLQKSEDVNSSPAKISCYNSGCHSNGLYADLKLSPSIDWHSSFHHWWKGELSNFEYLLILNRLAGRRMARLEQEQMALSER